MCWIRLWMPCVCQQEWDSWRYPLAGSLIHFLVRKIKGMTLNFGLYKHAQMMVCQLLVVWLNFCFNHCQLFVNQGATSSFLKKIFKHTHTHTKMQWKSDPMSLFFFKFLNIYLFWLCCVLIAACGIQIPDWRLNPDPLYWEPVVLAIGPPGKSLKINFLNRNLGLPWYPSWL